MRWTVGAITMMVRNNASDVTTCAGGIDCVPRACRNKASTTRMRTKQVVISMIDGTSESAVSRTMMFRTTVNPRRSPCSAPRPAGGTGPSGPPGTSPPNVAASAALLGKSDAASPIIRTGFRLGS